MYNTTEIAYVKDIARKGVKENNEVKLALKTVDPVSSNLIPESYLRKGACWWPRIALV